MKRILIIGYVWPEPRSSAAGRRMMELITLFLSQKWKVTFASPALRTAYSKNLSDIGVDEVVIQLNNTSFDVFVNNLQPSIVLFDRFMMEEQFGWRVIEQCPDAMRILDTEDLHCLRKAKQLALKENRLFKEEDLFSDIAKREIASIYRCDLSLIISTVEEKLLLDFFKIPKDLIYHLPFLLEIIDEKKQKEWPAFNSRQHFITIGNFLHAPNWDVVQYLKTTIWPLIRKQLPTVELHVYGAYTSAKVDQLHNPKEGFYIRGRAETVKEVMKNARVCLTPLRFGAGLKGKFIDAMENGTPSITTSIGAEGMYQELPWSGFIVNKIDDIVDAAIKLYTDESKWIIAQQNGIEIINQCYHKEKLSKGFTNALIKLQKNIEEHRIQNFTGSMLLYQSMNSTKYMSKWIEEKNKTS